MKNSGGDFSDQEENFDVDLPEDSKGLEDYGGFDSRGKRGGNEFDTGLDESLNFRNDDRKDPKKGQGNSRLGDKSREGLRNSNGGFSSNNFDEEFEDETETKGKSKTAEAMNKQVPPPKVRNGAPTDRNLKDGQVKDSKPSGFKKTNFNEDSLIDGGMKPTMSTYSIQQKRSNPASGYRISAVGGSKSRPNLKIYTGNATSRNMKESSLGRSIWDPYNRRPRHEQILDEAHRFIGDSYHRTLEELFEHNSFGTTLLRDINALLNQIIERRKSALVSGKTMPSLGESMGGEDIQKEQKIFQKEYHSGEKLLKNLYHELNTVTKIMENICDPLYLQNLKEEVQKCQDQVKAGKREVEFLKNNTKVLGRKIDNRDKYAELANKRKAVQNDYLGKIDKENLVRDIMTEDIQKKRVKLEQVDAFLKSHEIKVLELKSDLESLGQLETPQVKKFQAIEKDLELGEKNLLIFKKNWKGKLEKEKRNLDVLRETNETMLKESDELVSIIYQQKIMLEEMKDQEVEFKLVREQKKLEYQSQLDIMLLEHEVLQKELSYNKMKADMKAQSIKQTSKKLPPMIHDTSADLYEDEPRPIMKSKNVGASNLMEKRNRNTKEISMQADSVDSIDIRDYLNVNEDDRDDPEDRN